MVIKEVSTGIEYEAEIEPVSIADYKVIKKDKVRFSKFDWPKYKDKEVYKLRLKNNEDILGLMCITDHTEPETDAIEIELLEVANENVGSRKKFDFIGGCLIAFACRESLKRGHDGFVFLIPKTNLIEHYSSEYGFVHMPLRTPQRPEGLMIVLGDISRGLIQKYKA